MSYEIYKIMHLAGVMLLFGGLGGLAAVGALQPEANKAKPMRTLFMIFHGIGLLLMLVGGFGILARLKIGADAWGGWVYIKMVLWLGFGAAIVPLKRMPTLARVWLLLFVALGAVAAWLGVTKPF